MAEEAGCGVAFAGEGFKPCGGVFACLSFNRKEKCRVILGGDHLPMNGGMKHLPPGYRALGNYFGPCSIGDFSGREVGAELYSYQHRYNGADASVHLGVVGALGLGSGRSQADADDRWVDRSCLSESVSNELLREHIADEEMLLYKLGVTSYKLCILYVRRIILDALVTLPRGQSSIVQEASSRKLFRFIKACSSESYGLVGEAGAMVMSAECLGLGCSGFEGSGDGEGAVLLFNSFKILDGEGSREEAKSAEESLSECAEFALSLGGFGCLPFLKVALMDICRSSEGFRESALSSIEDAILNLSKIRLSSRANGDGEGDDGLRNPGEQLYLDDRHHGMGGGRSGIGVTVGGDDIRFVSWLTGLLLSASSKRDFDSLKMKLFVCWSRGLLSPSMPFRMIAAQHCSIFMRDMSEGERSLIRVSDDAGTLSFPPGGIDAKVKLYFQRLKGIVVSRIWAERAAAPVYSKYLQSLVELLLSYNPKVQHSGNDLIKLDCTVPTQLPRPYIGVDDHVVTDDWVTFRGELKIDGVTDASFVKVVAKQRTATRNLLDGGQGPPFLDVGMTVMRGADWKDDEYGVEDGWEEDGGASQEKDEGLDRGHVDVEEVTIKGGDDSSQGAGASVEEEENGEDDAEAEDGQQSITTTDAISVDGQQSIATDAATVETGGDNDTIASLDAPSIISEQSEEDDVIAAVAAAAQAKFELKKRKKKKLLVRKDRDNIEKAKKKKTARSKKAKISSRSIKSDDLPTLPIGTVIAITDYAGIKGAGRLVKWEKTGSERVYRWGVGGCFDLTHVETNRKRTKARRRYPNPECFETCAARNGFGKDVLVHCVLKLKPRDTARREWFGFLEMPMFGAGIQVKGTRNGDKMRIVEESLLWGAGHCGWNLR